MFSGSVLKIGMTEFVVEVWVHSKSMCPPQKLWAMVHGSTDFFSMVSSKNTSVIVIKSHDLMMPLG